MTSEHHALLMETLRQAARTDDAAFENRMAAADQADRFAERGLVLSGTWGTLPCLVCGAEVEIELPEEGLDEAVVWMTCCEACLKEQAA